MRHFTLYHNPRCSKSRQALALLQEQGIEPVVVEYLKHPLSIAQLKNLVSQLSVPVLGVCRKKEPEFLELQLENQSEEALFEALHTYPKLMERPIVTCGDLAAIGRPIENIATLIKENALL